MSDTEYQQGAQRPFFGSARVENTLPLSAHADTAGAAPSGAELRNKPRVRPDVMGFTCRGHGVEGHGMTVCAAYESWEQRFLRQRTHESSQQLLAEARRDYPHLHDATTQ